MTKHRSKKRGQRTSHQSGNPAKRNRVRHGPPAKPKPHRPGALSAPPAPASQQGEADTSVREIAAELTEFYRRLADVLTNEHPINFLELSSYLYAIAAGGKTIQHDAADGTELLRTYATSDVRVFKAAAYAMTRMVGADEQRDLVEQAIGSAVEVFPTWLQQLDGVQVTQAWVGVDELAANATVGIGFRFPTGEQATLLGMINLDLGVVPLDVAVVPLAAGEAGRDWHRDNPGWELSDLSLADARALWAYALILEDLHSPAEPDDWRRLRSMIDWVLSLLPENGGHYRIRGLPSVDVDHAVDDFLRSPCADELRGDPDTESIAHSCLSVRDGWHDPLRWSALAVELFLLRRVPRWHPLGRAYMIKIPGVLAALIRYGHQLRSVDPQHTENATTAIETHTPACVEALERQWARHGTEQGVSGRRLLDLLEADTADEAEGRWG